MKSKILVLFSSLILIIANITKAVPQDATISNENNMIVFEQIQKEKSAIEQAREWAAYNQRLEEITCYQKFFINSCIEESKERLRPRMAELRRREINNNQAQRNYEAQQREVNKLQDAADREIKQSEEALQRIENQKSYQRKLEEMEHRLKEKNNQQKQFERDKNIRKYQQKQQDAVQRKQALEKRNQDKKHQSGSFTDPLSLPDGRTQGDR